MVPTHALQILVSVYHRPLVLGREAHTGTGLFVTSLTEPKLPECFDRPLRMGVDSGARCEAPSSVPVFSSSLLPTSASLLCRANHISLPRGVTVFMNS